MRHPCANGPSHEESDHEIAQDRGPFHDEHVRHGGESLRRDQPGPERALGLNGHVHRGVALHGAGEAFVGLFAGFVDELLADEEPEQHGDKRDHDRAADELGNRPPQAMGLPLDLDEHLVEMPLIIWPGPTATQLVREGLPELAAPLLDGFVGDQDTTSHHQFLNLPQAQRKPVIQPHTVAEYLHRVAVPLVQLTTA
jgi:hypothetical protein